MYSINLSKDEINMLDELNMYSISHGSGSKKRSELIRICISQTYDCCKKHYAKSLLSYFDELSNKKDS